MSMGMIGESNHGLDAKGRLIIPIRFRQELGDKFVLCYGMDHNIDVYPEAEWTKFAEKLAALPKSNFQARRLRDFYEGSAVVCEMDSQYRIVIPQKLREYAGIDREVVMIGHTDTVAIWDKAAWDKINSPEEIDLKEIAEIGELFNI